MTTNHDIDLRIDDADVRRALTVVCEAVRREGGRAYLVGGCVRDAALGLPARDLDIEVFRVPADRLQAALGEVFALDLVGQSFGVIKLKGLPIDISLPRRESKAGRGHRGFAIASDPEMRVEEAAARRDFTINAVYFDPLREQVEDPFQGLPDLRNGLLRHTSAAFSDDPLRVLRAAQFAARFELRVDPRTVELCRTIGLEGLASERIFEEWRKLLLLGKRPSLGLSFLRDCGWLDHFPELAALVDLPQDPDWHPEGDAWVHTLHCLDAFAAERIGDDWEDLVVGLAVLCHDFGKADTTRWTDGHIRSRGHEQAGVELTRAFLGRLSSHNDLAPTVIPLVANHMVPQHLFKVGAGDAAVRRLAGRVGRIDRLVRVARADVLGRPPRPDRGFPAGRWLLERAQALAVSDAAPEPLVKGRHLIAMGLQPGPRFGAILDTCYEAQLDGEFDSVTEGREFAARLVAELPGEE